MSPLLKRVSAAVVGLLAALGTVGLALLLTGRSSVVVTEGISMKPAYHQGDLVIVTKRSSYHVGEIAAYRLPGARALVLHRIVGGTPAGYLMKGDNNQSTDPTKPSAAQLAGSPSLHVPHLGSWLKRLSSPVGLGLLALTFTALGATAEGTRRSRKRRRPMPRQMSTRPLDAVTTWSPRMRTGAAAVGVVALVGAGLAAVAWSSPTRTTTTGGSQKPDSAVTFSYTADVGRSAAYDGTTVRSPDPVFRKVANLVQLRYVYQGKAGTVRLSADLSTASGWRSTVALPSADSTDTSGRVVLDLNALYGRAQAAAKVIGLPNSQVTVTVAATVTTRTAGSGFVARLPMTLTAAQLSVPASSTLTVSDAAPAGVVVTVDRTLSLAGAKITVSAMRALSAGLLVVAALGAVLLLLLARRSKPANEGAGIHRRYGPLLVAVEPIMTSRGRPIIDVSEFATLARLAERYGLLVLHWTRSGIETFIVQDDATTYRYRTQLALDLDAGIGGPAAPNGLIPPPASDVVDDAPAGDSADSPR